MKTKELVSIPPKEYQLPLGNEEYGKLYVWGHRLVTAMYAVPFPSTATRLIMSRPKPEKGLHLLSKSFPLSFADAALNSEQFVERRERYLNVAADVRYEMILKQRLLNKWGDNVHDPMIVTALEKLDFADLRELLIRTDGKIPKDLEAAFDKCKDFNIDIGKIRKFSRAA